MNESKKDFIERIYSRYASRLERMCLYYVNFQENYRDLVDDSIQKTFEIATREYKELQNNPYLEGWLYKTCKNRLTTAINTYRRRMRKQYSLDDEMEFTLPPEQIQNAVDEVVNKICNQELLDKILSSLNEREKNIVKRHFIHGESVKDIAKKDGKSIGAVKAILARIRMKARNIGSGWFRIFSIIFVSFFHVIRLKK